MNKRWDAQEIRRKAEEESKAYSDDLAMRWAYESGILSNAVGELCGHIRNAQHCPDYLLDSTHETLVKLLQAAKRVAEEMQDEADMNEVLDGIDDCLTFAERAEPRDHAEEAASEREERRFEGGRE